MRKLLFLIATAMLVCVGFSSAQTGNITGIVRDSKTGLPISGATIKVRGSGVYVSNFDGTFTIKAPKQEILVDYSSIGYLPKTMKAQPGSAIKIDLGIDSRALSEVVVTGVGVATSKKKLGIS